MTEGPVMTPAATLLLWRLIARGGGAALKDLQPVPDAKARGVLRVARLISEPKAGRGLRLHVEERGWAWAAGNMGAALPARSTAGVVVLADLLPRLGAYLSSREVSLADLIHPPTERVEPPSSPNGLDRRIRDAYLAETGGAVNRRARLSAIRARLADVPRGALDEGLIMLARHGGAELMPLDNPVEIGPEDRAAAITVGFQPSHLLWFHR